MCDEDEYFDEDVNELEEELCDEDNEVFDDSYFDEEFGVYEEPPIDMSEPVPEIKRYGIPVPNKHIQEPTFGVFVSLRPQAEPDKFKLHVWNKNVETPKIVEKKVVPTLIPVKETKTDTFKKEEETQEQTTYVLHTPYQPKIKPNAVRNKEKKAGKKERSIEEIIVDIKKMETELRQAGKMTKEVEEMIQSLNGTFIHTKAKEVHSLLYTMTGDIRKEELKNAKRKELEEAKKMLEKCVAQIQQGVIPNPNESFFEKSVYDNMVYYKYDLIPRLEKELV